MQGTGTPRAIFIISSPPRGRWTLSVYLETSHGGSFATPRYYLWNRAPLKSMTLRGVLAYRSDISCIVVSRKIRSFTF